MSTISDRLKIVMSDNNLSQTALAKALSINQSSVSLWLSGRSNPSPQSLQQIADKYGYNFDWLSTGEGDPRSLAAAEKQIIEVLSHAIKHKSTASDRFIRSVAQVAASPYGEEIIGSTLEFLRRVLDEYNAEHPPDDPK